MRKGSTYAKSSLVQDGITILIWVPVSVALAGVVALVAQSTKSPWLHDLIRVVGAVGIMACAGVVWFACQKWFGHERPESTDADVVKSQFLNLLIRELRYPEVTSKEDRLFLQFEQFSDASIIQMLDELRKAEGEQDDSDADRHTVERGVLSVYRSGGAVTERTSHRSGLGDAGRLMRKLNANIFEERHLCQI